MKLKFGILGGEGLLGAELVRHFGGVPITRLSYASLLGSHFDVFINANGNTKRHLAVTNPLLDFQLTTETTYKSLFDFSFDKYVYISSSNVYNTQLGGDVFPNELAPITKHPYGFNKYLSEEVVKCYAKNYLILRPSLLAGSGLSKGVLAHLLEKKELFIKPPSRLQIITTSEVAAILETLLAQDICNDTFNVGGVGGEPLEKMVEQFDYNYSYHPDAKVVSTVMNVDKLNKMVPLKSSADYWESFKIKIN